MQRWNLNQHELMPELRNKVGALLSSASMHDSLAAMPLAMMTAERVTNCYDLMDAAYCSSVLREHSQAERVNARVKDDYGGRFVRVRGHAKVMSHLMFGMLALTAEQLMRLLT